MLYIIFSKVFKQEKIYLFHIISSILFGFIPVLVMIFLWKAIYRNAEIREFTEGKMIGYYYIVYFIDTMIHATNLSRTISLDIRLGTINNMLLKPISYNYFYFVNHMSEKIIQCIIIMGPMLLFFLFFRDSIEINWSQLPLFIIALLLAIILNYLMYFLIGLSSFWFLENGGLIQLFNNATAVISGAIIPLFLFPKGLQNLFKLLPFQYTIYFPASVLLQSKVELSNFLIIGGWILIFYILCHIMWNKGILKNEGTGI